MNYKEYGDNRWEIVYGSYEGAQRRAVNRLYGMVQQFVPYVLTVSKAAEALPECKNLILIGTLNNHPVLRRLNENKFYTAEGRSEGYSIGHKLLNHTVKAVHGTALSALIRTVNNFPPVIPVFFIIHKSPPKL